MLDDVPCEVGTRPHRSRPLRGRDLVAVAAAIAIVSFAARLAFPLGSDQFHLQLSAFAQYAILFGFGVVAGGRGWLEGLSPRLARRCGIAALTTLLTLPLILAAGGFFAGSKHAFAGGWHWQALAAAAVEGALAVSACLWLIAVFRRRINRQGTLMRRLGGAAYGAFLIHPLVIVGLAVGVHQLAIAAGLKLAIVLVAGISGSFALAGIAMGLIERRGQLATPTRSRLRAPSSCPTEPGATPMIRLNARLNAASDR